METTHQKTSPRDFFLHLLHIITLYGSAVSFLTLVFQFINIGIPDITQEPYGSEFARAIMRSAVAFLLVMFPALVLTGWLLEKSYAEAPEKKNVRIRKWLIYLTLFIASLVVIGDLVTLLQRLLEGELTLRFVLKSLSVFTVTGAIFWYYSKRVREAPHA